jgi:very-short-patch-repair endonuclease
MREQIDTAIAALAKRQHGLVSWAQLLALGLSAQAVHRRVCAGRLHVIYRGVYAVGHPVLTLEGRWMAAVLACGEGAVLSHGSAAAAWDLRPLGAGAIHVTVPSTAGRSRRTGLRLHRSRTLAPDDTTTHRAIPITTPARTIIDLARTLTDRPLEKALDRADQLGLIDFAELNTRPIPLSLQAQLARYEPTLTRSEAEEALLGLCDAYNLPRPETNTIIEGEEVDAVWREAKLIVEVDGYRYHRSPTAFETDRARDVKLTLAGWRVLRFTYAQITQQPAYVAAALQCAL